MEAYLGIDLKFNDNSMFQIHELFLIDKILELIENIDQDNSKHTPVIKSLLQSDLDGMNRRMNWNIDLQLG